MTSSAGNVVVKHKKRLRILVAEDNTVNQKVAVRMLEKIGHTADIAGNGVEVLRAISHATYDIVFMDCQMPEMDGFEATLQIREMDGTARHTHIVAMTANALQGDKEKCIAASMDDYIAKPIRHTDLAGAIDRWLSRKQGAEPDSAKAVDAGRLLDESVLQELGDIDKEDESDFVAELLEIFLRETPGRIDEICRVAGTGDLHGLQSSAHQLKGACKQLGLIAMVDLCQKIEDLGKSNGVRGCDELLSALGAVFSETAELLRVKYSLRER
jgi:CheY-like chemotaxis protein